MRWTRRGYIGMQLPWSTAHKLSCFTHTQSFIFCFYGPAPPLSGANQRVAYPDPRNPLPESLAAQGPYVRLPCPGLARARNVSRHWSPPRACYRVPCCETSKRDFSSPKESSGWSLWFPPDPGWNKQKAEIPRLDGAEVPAAAA